MSNYLRPASVAFAALLLCGAAPQLAAHSDVELELQANTIVVDPDGEAETSAAVKPGRKLFEVEFGEFLNDFGTDDPGFVASAGSGFTGGTILAFQVLDTLMKWNGSAWASSGFDEFITIEDALGTVLSVSATLGSGSGFIDAFSGAGGLHSHLEFEIGKTGGGMPDDGAYLLELALFGVKNDLVTPIYNPSAPFLIAFHLNAGGMFGDEDFELAVSALTTPIPLPPAVWLLGSALAFGASRMRRQRSH